MKTPCEIFSREFLPSIKALLAKSVMEAYSLTQHEAARRLKTTQPAISHYLREARGKKAKELEKDEEIRKKIQEMVGKLNKEVDEVEFFRFFCDVCRVLRERKRFCKYCNLGENCTACLRGDGMWK